ncbi:MAG TPA: hypothetical protein PLW86_17130 [Rhodocyclaceae bacterium]|nr:hypothetical protein [Rhodocyclaceae bacterium]
MTPTAPPDSVADALDFGAAAEIIARLPLHQPVEAEIRLGNLLGRVLAQPPSASELFSLLEYARPSLHFVRATAVRHYHDLAPHLEAQAEAHFQRGLELWQRVVAAYQRCAELERPADPQAAAALLHRCLMYSGMQIIEHYRAKREVPADLWRQLHGYYHIAEQEDLSRIALVHDLPDEPHTPNIQAQYVAHLLLEIAQPYSRNATDFNLIWQWAERWAHLVRVGKPRIAAGMIAFVVDLAGDRPLHPRAGGTLPESIRALGTKALIEALHAQLADLDHPDAGERLHLSSEGVLRHRHLLDQLVSSWSMAMLPRRFKRTPSAETVTLTASFHGIHEALSQPAARAASTETWRVIDHTPNGFRLARESDGLPIENGQLVALCPHDGGDYLLAQVQWLMRDQSGFLLAGFSILPGIPRSIGMAAEERFKGQNVRLVRAFLLPAVAAMQSEASLVIPSGFYQAGRIVDVDDGKWQLGELIQRGNDFDRASYRQI